MRGVLISSPGSYLTNLIFCILFLNYTLKTINILVIGSSKFEIIEKDNVIVTGIVRIPVNIEDENVCTTFIDRDDNDEEEMNSKDIYKELKLRGYQYTDAFRGLKSASITGKNGHITWTGNWVAFIENVLQMMILGHKSRSLFVPTRIRKMIIDPKSHMQQIETLENNEKRKFKIL